jgi:hypothetical protein
MVCLGNNAAVVALVSLCLAATSLVSCAGDAASRSTRLPSPTTPREPPTTVDGFVRELRDLDVTLPNGEAVRFDSLVTRPVGTGPYPLVILNHGSPRDAASRASMTPTNYAAQALAFARRGYGAVVFMRRGYGQTSAVNAYRGGGAPADYVAEKPFGDDGHFLFNAAAWVWWPDVAPFVAKLGLPTDVARPRAVPVLQPPSQLSTAGRSEFGRYLESEGYEKAFATDGHAWAWVSGRRTRAEAADDAIARCELHGQGCTAYAVGDELVR